MRTPESIPANPIAAEIVRTEQVVRDIDEQITELTARKTEHLSVIDSLEATGLAEWTEPEE